jgi:outer membrane lipoprotein-sorting protein
MIRVVWISLLAALLTFAAADPLAAILAKMDEAAAGFKGLSADLTRIQHTGVINEDSKDAGSIVIKRSKPHDTRVLFDVKEPDPKMMFFDGHKGEQYLPNANLVEEYDLSKYRGLVDELLLLGFGTTSKELSSAYTLSYGGPETLNGEKTTRIQLVPKSPDQRKYFVRVDLWISDTTGVSVQQKFYEPGGDYQLATYSNIKLNPNIPDSELKLNLPKGVKREYPGK